MKPLCTKYIKSIFNSIIRLKGLFFKKPALFSPILILLIALWPSLIQAQSTTTVLDKKITIQFNNTGLTEVLKSIEEKTGCTITYSNNEINGQKKISVSASQKTIREILYELLGKDISLRVVDNQVLIRFALPKGRVKGTVKTSDGKPAEFVTVMIKGIAATSVDKNGDYQLKNIPEGTYTISASIIGLGTQSRQVQVGSGQVASIDFILSESGQQLNEVVIGTHRANLFASTKSEDVAKMPLKDLENSQVTSVVSNELIKAQMLTNFKDAMKNATGIVSLGQDGAYSTRGFVTFPNMRNGVAAYNTTDIDLANIEKIEVLKGPAGTLFGSPLVSFGGLINKVTKQPYGHTGGEATYTQGSYGLSRFTGDFNTPLTKDTTVMLRVNAAHTRQGSFMDFGFNKSTFFAPTILYKPNDRLSISVEGEFYQNEGISPPFIFFGNSSQYQLYMNNYTRSFNKDDMVMQTSLANIYGEVKYKLSDHWTSQTLISYTGSNGPKGTNVQRYFQGADSVRRAVDDYKTNTTTTNEIQQNFISDYKWGNMRNRLVTGLDFYSYNYNYEDYYMNFDVVSMINPGADYLRLSMPNVLAKEQAGDPDIDHETGRSKNYIYAAFISDVFNLSDNLLINAALRVDRFDNKGNFDPVSATWSGNYKQTALSPKFGIVYQPVKDFVSLFANYSNGFQNNTGVSFGGNPFKPSNGSQLEGGVKLDAWQHRLSATISYFHIRAYDLLEPDPDHLNYSIQDARQTSKGLEASIIAAPLSGLNIVAGYSINKKTVEQGDNSYAPKNLANLYVSYQLTEGKVKGLGLSFGGNYAGESETTKRYGFNLPGYTILNASVFYDKQHYRFGIRSDNITDKKYFIGYFDLEPQMLRSISATMAIKF